MSSIRKAMGALPLGPNGAMFPWVFSRSRWNSYFLHDRAPSPTCYPPQGPIGATLGTAMNNLYSSPKKVSTHYITWLFYFWIWRRSLKFAWFWPLGAFPLGPHEGHMYHMNNFKSLAPKDDSCQVWLKSNHTFSRRRWKCKKFTDDGQKRTAIAHLSLRLRWAKKQMVLIRAMVQDFAFDERLTFYSTWLCLIK